MRKILIAAFVANLLLTAVSLAILPDRVAIHFGAGGAPDSWASKEFHATIFLVLEAPFFLMFYFAPMLTLGVSSRFLSIPNKDFWLLKENQAEFRKRFGRYMAEFGVAIFIFFFCISALAVQANLSHPVQLDEVLFMVVFISFMLYTLWWVVRIIQGLRVPAART